MEVVDQSLGPECSSQVKDAFVELESWMKTTDSASTLIKLFNLCDLDVKNEKTYKNFISEINGLFAGVVQYNEDNRVGWFSFAFLGQEMHFLPIAIGKNRIFFSHHKTSTTKFRSSLMGNSRFGMFGISYRSKNFSPKFRTLNFREWLFGGDY